VSDELSIQLDVVLVERHSKGGDVERDVEDSEEDESELSLVVRRRRVEQVSFFLFVLFARQANSQGSKPRTHPNPST